MIDNQRYQPPTWSFDVTPILDALRSPRPLTARAIAQRAYPRWNTEEARKHVAKHLPYCVTKGWVRRYNSEAAAAEQTATYQLAGDEAMQAELEGLNDAQLKARAKQEGLSVRGRFNREKLIDRIMEAAGGDGASEPSATPASAGANGSSNGHANTTSDDTRPSVPDLDDLTTEQLDEIQTAEDHLADATIAQKRARIVMNKAKWDLELATLERNRACNQADADKIVALQRNRQKCYDAYERAKAKRREADAAFDQAVTRLDRAVQAEQLFD